MVSRSYRKIVVEYHPQHPPECRVRLTNTGDWRFDHCSRAHYQVTRGRLVRWHEDGASVFGFETAEQAATFQSWADTCGIDWTVEPRAQPLPHPKMPPERPWTYGPTPRGR